jgi:hypothetical protein
MAGVYVGNGGSQSVGSVWAEIVETPQFVEDVLEMGYHDQWTALYELKAGHVVKLFSVSFSVAKGALTGPLTFGVSIHDGSGAVWDDSFAVQVSQTSALLVIDHIEMDGAGRNDAYIRAGETGLVAVYVKNTGTAKAMEVWGETKKTPQYVEYMVGMGYHDQWAALYELKAGQVVNLFAVSFSVVKGAPAGAIVFPVLLHDGTGGAWQDQFEIEVYP